VESFILFYYLFYFLFSPFPSSSPLLSHSWIFFANYYCFQHLHFVETPLISCMLISQNCKTPPDWPQWICQGFSTILAAVSFLSWEHQWVLIQPGYLRPLLPDSAPTEPETVEAVFAGKASRRSS
jgi:hypothetical protein